MIIDRRRFLGATAAFGIAGTAHAQTNPAPAYPSKPVTLFVPFTAGSGTDTMARIFGERLAAVSGQSVVVEPLNGRRLQYRWVRGDAADARPAAWWRRASVGNGAPAWGDACCA
mgnify:CR=1 FL=1